MNDLTNKTIEKLTWKAVRNQTTTATTKEMQDSCFAHELDKY